MVGIYTLKGLNGPPVLVGTFETSIVGPAICFCMDRQTARKITRPFASNPSVMEAVSDLPEMSDETFDNGAGTWTRVFSHAIATMAHNSKLFAPPAIQVPTICGVWIDEEESLHGESIMSFHPDTGYRADIFFSHKGAVDTLSRLPWLEGTQRTGIEEAVNRIRWSPQLINEPVHSFTKSPARIMCMAGLFIGVHRGN